MRGKPLGCITGLGGAAVLATVLIVAGLVFFTGGEMFSPGLLNAASGQNLGGVQSHAEIGGRCELCHAPPWDDGGMAGRCIGCHAAIDEEITDAGTLHGALQAQKPALTCRDCHPEHRGIDAPLTEVSETDFPHDVLGFALAGHAEMEDGSPFDCGDCHTEHLSAFDPAVCLRCHQEIEPQFTEAHVAWTGTVCLDCHDGVDRYGSEFDHSATAFALTGLHAEIDCARCHPGVRTAVDLQNTPKDCFSCHQADDPHAGGFGEDCAACHSAEGWLPAVFDHNLAGFPLTGSHQAVACLDCHTGGILSGAPRECAGCHADPGFHAGLFGLQCADCHSTSAWQPAEFNLPHTFPIDHEDARTCRDCHPGALSTWTCSTCHSQTEVIDEHDEPIEALANCVGCHPTGDEDEAENRGDGDDD